MGVRDDDIGAARRATRALEQATSAVVRHFGDTVDVQRLRADVQRLSVDLDLLCGAEAAAAPAATPPQEVPDTPYTHDFWLDAEDEGLGSSSDRSRR